MKQRYSQRIARLVIAGLPLAIGCGDLGGNSSQAGNPRITGVIYEQNGGRAIHALVKAIPDSYNPVSGDSQDKAVYSTRTNDTGGFFLDSLQADTYNLFGEGSSGLSYKTSVVVPENARVLADDTLRAPGSIRGVVRLQPGDDSRSVFIIVLGTATFGAPDDAAGNFQLSNMARGTYRVRLISPQATYAPLDTVFTVQSGRALALTDTLVLPYTGIPVPQGLKSSYDSLLQIVTLRWNAPAAGRPVKGYNVYRQNSDSNASALLTRSALAVDTLFRDSSGVQGATYEYRVAAIDTSGAEGAKSAPVSVTTSSSLMELTGTIIKGEGTGPGQFSQVTTGEVDVEGNIYVMDGGNNRLQKLDSAGNFKFWINVPFTTIGFAVAPDRTFFTINNQINTVDRYDSSGTMLKSWGLRNVPRSLLLHSDTLYVLTDRGIEKFDTAGQLVGKKEFSLDFSYAGGDFCVDSKNNIYVSDGIYVYRYYQTLDSLKILYKIKDPYHNQNPRITMINDGLILISTTCAGQPFVSSCYAVDTTGRCIARWYSSKATTDMAVKNANQIVGWTANGEILFYRFSPVF